jgi:hypothetical protein
MSVKYKNALSWALSPSGEIVAAGALQSLKQQRPFWWRMAPFSYISSLEQSLVRTGMVTSVLAGFIKLEGDNDNE